MALGPQPQPQAAEQPMLDLPLDKAATTAIVRAHVTAWLTNDFGETLPSLVSECVRARQWGPAKFAARVRLFDGAPATIFVEGAPKKRRGDMPKIRHDGDPFFFHGGEWAWQRFQLGETKAMVAARVGKNFY